MTRIRIFLKNGLVLPDIVCEKFSIKCSNLTGDIEQYEYKNAQFPAPLHIKPDEIVAVYQMPLKEESAPCPHFTNGCGYLEEYVEKCKKDLTQQRPTKLVCPYPPQSAPFTLCPLWPYKEENANG